jgi:hypothetical protein
VLAGGRLVINAFTISTFVPFAIIFVLASIMGTLLTVGQAARAEVDTAIHFCVQRVPRIAFELSYLRENQFVLRASVIGMQRN